MLSKGIVKRAVGEFKKQVQGEPFVGYVSLYLVNCMYTSAIWELFQTSSKAGLLSPDSVSVAFSIYFFNVGWEDPLIIWERNNTLMQASVLYITGKSK